MVSTGYNIKEKFFSCYDWMNNVSCSLNIHDLPLQSFTAARKEDMEK